MLWWLFCSQSLKTEFVSRADGFSNGLRFVFRLFNDAVHYICFTSLNEMKDYNVSYASVSNTVLTDCTSDCGFVMYEARPLGAHVVSHSTEIRLIITDDLSLFLQ